MLHPSTQWICEETGHEQCVSEVRRGGGLHGRRRWWGGTRSRLADDPRRALIPPDPSDWVLGSRPDGAAQDWIGELGALGRDA